MSNRKVQKLDENGFTARLQWLQYHSMADLDRAARNDDPRLGMAQTLDEIKRIAEQCALYLRSNQPDERRLRSHPGHLGS